MSIEEEIDKLSSSISEAENCLESLKHKVAIAQDYLKQLKKKNKDDKRFIYKSADGIQYEMRTDHQTDDCTDCALKEVKYLDGCPHLGDHKICQLEKYAYWKRIE